MLIIIIIIIIASNIIYDQPDDGLEKCRNM